MDMGKTLLLLDGMALLYRAHSAFITNPIRNSKGFNTSALHGLLNVVLDLRSTHQPTHMAMALDGLAPTMNLRTLNEHQKHMAKRITSKWMQADEALNNDLHTFNKYGKNT